MHRKELEARFCMADWEFMQKLPTARLFRNRYNGRHCEEYMLSLYSDRDKVSFEQRAASTASQLVKILHFECFSCFNASNVFTHYNARVFVEHVRFRISELTDIPENSCLTMLEQTLQGFKIIFEEYQPVRVLESMICLNEDRRIRVWLSPNPLDNFARVASTTTEQIMVSDIFKIFWRLIPCLDDRPAAMDFLQAFDYVRMKKTRPQLPRKVVGVNPPTSIDFAPVFKATQPNEKMYRTAERLHVGPGSTTTLGISPRKHNVTQYVGPVTSYESPNKSHIVSVRHNPSMDPSGHQLMVKDDQLEKQQIQSSYDKQSYAPGFDSDEDCQGRRQSIVVRIESARTTSKNISVNQRFIELDRNELQLEFLDPKKNKDTKLAMIESLRINQPNDQNVQKLCRIYNHALKYDPLMYLELQKHQGVLSNITNMYVVKKLTEIVEQDPNENSSDHNSKYRGENRATRIKTQDQRRLDEAQQRKRQERVKQILEIERAKRTKTIYNKSINYVSSNQQLNKTSPQPSKTSIETPANPPAQPQQKRRTPSYINELESLIGPSHESDRVKARSGSITHNIEQKKKQKNRFMKGFKQEVEKLLFD